MKNFLNCLFNEVHILPMGVKASFAFFFATLVTKGIAYVTTPIFTRLLPPDEFGQVSVFLTWLHLLGIVAMFCLSFGVFNNGMVDYPERRGEFSFSMLGLSNLVTLAFATVFLGGFHWFRPYLGVDFSMAVLMCAVFLLQPAYNFWTHRQRYELKWKGTTFWVVSLALLSPLSAILFIKLFPGHRVQARIFGSECVLLLVYLGFYFHIAAKSRFHLDTSFWKMAFWFNLPLIPHYLSSHLLASSDRLMIAHLVGTTATAYYSVAHSVAAVVLIVWSSAHTSLIPFIYENCKAGNYAAISKVTLPILAVFGGTCILLVLLAPEVVALMATKDYGEAVSVIPPIVAGVFFQVHYFLYADVLYYFKHPRFVMFGSVTAMLTNLVLNYLCIPRFGYVAAGYTTLACYMLQAAIDYIAMRRVVGHSIYNMRLILLLSAILCTVCLACLSIYAHPIPRYIILTLLLLALLQQRRRVIRIFTAFKKKPNPA